MRRLPFRLLVLSVNENSLEREAAVNGASGRAE